MYIEVLYCYRNLKTGRQANNREQLYCKQQKIKGTVKTEKWTTEDKKRVKTEDNIMYVCFYGTTQ